METERYIITLFGVNTKYYTVDFVAYLWDQIAQKEYEKSGIFITAILDVRSLVCGEVRGCVLGDDAHVITTVRNPSEVSDSSIFFESFRNVVQEVREELGNPNMTMTIQKIEYYYFIQPKL